MIAKITDHAARAAARLLSQYRGKPFIEGLVTALSGNTSQDLEDATYALYGRLDIDGSVGAQLDGIGTIVNQGRLGQLDDVYRILIRARIAINNSQGTIEDVILAWLLLMDANQVEVKDIYPAQVDLYTDKTTGDPALDILALSLIQDVVATGVLIGFAAVFNPLNAFAFDGDDVNTGGFGSATDALAGGEFAHLIA